MVKSGLVERTDVSQYRLAAHFGIALVILGYTLWLLFALGERPTSAHARGAEWVASVVLALIFVQILAGALVAGLDAGIGFNTWPLINGAFVPSGLGEAQPFYLNLFENPLTVQFDHRMLGYAVVVTALGQVIWLAVKGAPQTSDRQCVGAGAIRRAASHARRVDVAASGADHARAGAPGRRHRRVRRRALPCLAGASPAALGRAGLDRFERLIEIGDDVVGIFQSDRQPHHLRPGAGSDLLLVGELAVRGRGRMDDEAARVADIREMTEQLDVADQRHAGIIAALEPESEHRARALWGCSAWRAHGIGCRAARRN